MKVPADDTDLIQLLAHAQLSHRTYSALARSKLRTVGDVRRLSMAELARLRGIGSVGWRELQSAGIANTTAVQPPTGHATANGATPSTPALVADVVTRARAGDPVPPSDRTTLRELHEERLLTTRTLNALSLAHHLTVGDVRRLSAMELIRIRNVGPRALDELLAAGVFGAPSGVVTETEPLEEPDRPGEQATTNTDDDAHPDLQHGTAESARTLVDLESLLTDEVPQQYLDLLSDRENRTLAVLAQQMNLTRQRVSQLEQRARHRVEGMLRRHAPTLAARWYEALDGGPISEPALFGPDLASDVDVNRQMEVGRLLLRACFDDVKPAEAYGVRLTGYWTRAGRGYDVPALMRELADMGPYADDGLDEAFMNFGIEAALGRRVLAIGEHCPLVWHPGTRAWVRRSAQMRDACWIILERAGRPASPAVLGRITGLTERNVNANLERDERFRRLHAQKTWALVVWGDLGEGTRYRTTREALIDILSAEGPLDREDLIARVLRAHPVSTWAITNQLEDEVFGVFPDGRVGLAFQGGRPFEEEEPDRPPTVKTPRPDEVTVLLPVTRDMLRGSGLGVPRYVTWWMGLRRAPRKRDFTTDEGETVTLTRGAGSSVVSSLRSSIAPLGLVPGCQLSLTLSGDRAVVQSACPCH